MIKERGEAFVLVIIVVAVVLVFSLSLIGGATLYFNNTTYSYEAEKAAALAEAGIDKAIVSLNKTGDSYSGEPETSLGGGAYAVDITTKNTVTKIIEATGYIPNKEDPKVKRTIKIEASKGVGVSFVYGIQVGEGGLELGNNNQVQGTIYSNGNIIAGNNNVITGDAWVAGGIQPNPDQQTDCEGSNCNDFIFGKSVNGEVRLDVAQSFKPSLTSTINKISLKIKKQGNPADVIVRIMRDDDGKPDKNGVITTGTLFGSLVTSSFGWIDVTFSSSPQLLANTSYWLMIDTSSDNSNFWIWQNDLAQSYARGLPLWSPNWSTGNPTWNAFSGELSFKTYMGGTVTSIRGGNNFQVQNDVYANTIENITIIDEAFYQTIINSTVSGQSCSNNPKCHPGSADSPPKVFPISEANITEWKNQAAAAGTSLGDITNCVSVLESKKIVGNVSFNSNCTVTVKSPIWITGNLSLGNNNRLRLSPEYGVTSGVVVVDGKVTLGNNNDLEGTGQGSSLLMALATFDSRTNNEDAIAIGNNGNSGVFYADKGIINPGNDNQFKELTAWKITLTNNSIINYEQGLSSTLFSSGPGGSFSLVKGTYQIK
ncbi:hypothetical protein HY387_00860 [Candidatus Daviesbacteria bacterium]|nr:hypothetical protein [Candidatus Daviesbacteria bacterium]